MSKVNALSSTWNDLCALISSCTLLTHGYSEHQKFPSHVSNILALHLAPWWHSGCFWSLGVSLVFFLSFSEANRIFPHISINNYYAYNTRFWLPPGTNAPHFCFICFFGVCKIIFKHSDDRYIKMQISKEIYADIVGNDQLCCCYVCYLWHCVL